MNKTRVMDNSTHNIADLLQSASDVITMYLLQNCFFRFVMVVIKIRGKRNDLNLLLAGRYHPSNKPRRCCCSTLSLFGKYHYLRGFFFYCFYCFDMDSIFKATLTDG